MEQVFHPNIMFHSGSVDTRVSNEVIGRVGRERETDRYGAIITLYCEMDKHQHVEQKKKAKPRISEACIDCLYAIGFFRFSSFLSLYIF